MKKILSIDWDYFINCDNDKRYYLFPDAGREYNPELMEIIWSKYYHMGKSKEEILDIDIDIENYDKLSKWMDNTNLKNTKFYSSLTHYSIFKMVEIEKLDLLEIINIDFHHDFYSHSKEKDCGNWLYYFKENLFIKEKPTWIRRENSDIENVEEYLNIKVDDFSFLENENYIPDYIFFCKSLPWSPPHLDDYFYDLATGLHLNCKTHISLSDAIELNDRYRKMDKYKDIYFFDRS